MLTRDRLAQTGKWKLHFKNDATPKNELQLKGHGCSLEGRGAAACAPPGRPSVVVDPHAYRILHASHQGVQCGRGRAPLARGPSPCLNRQRWSATMVALEVELGHCIFEGSNQLETDSRRKTNREGKNMWCL
jgi:hypothetical protein